MFVSRVAKACRAVPVTCVPARHGLLALADVPDRERRDGGPELVIRRKDAWLVSSRQAMPVLARRRYEIGEPVEELKRREFDNAMSSRPRGLPPTIPPDPVGRLVPGEHVADLGDAAAGAAASIVTSAAALRRAAIAGWWPWASWQGRGSNRAKSDPHTLEATARAATRLTRPRPAHRLGRARSAPRRPRRGRTWRGSAGSSRWMSSACPAQARPSEKRPGGCRRQVSRMAALPVGATRASGSTRAGDGLRPA
jgi:hypothetical protein